MANNSNPAIVWRRILTDVARLADVTKRNGTDQQKADVARAIDVLNAVAESFNLTPINPNLPASLNIPIQAALATTPMQEGFVAYKRGLMHTDCPFPAGSPEAGEWLKGWMSAAPPDPYYPAVDDDGAT